MTVADLSKVLKRPGYKAKRKNGRRLVPHGQMVCSRPGCNRKLGLRDGKDSYCRPCKAEYMRLHRPKHRDLKPLAKLKANCRSYSHVLLKRGKLRRESCEVAGCKRRAQMHHENYWNPRKVRWLCQKHHLEHHKEEKAAAVIEREEVQTISEAA